MDALAAAHSPTFAANRARGSVRFDVRAADGVTRRGELHESGSLRVRFPSPEAKGGLSAVFVNTAGGIAGGDHFEIAIDQSGGSLALTTAAAEKVYRSHGPAARLDLSLSVGEGARMVWLPQETILFNAARLDRHIEVDVAGSGALLLGEIMAFGRQAMGEAVREGALSDRWRVRIDDRLVFAENVRLDDDIAATLARPAVANGGVAIGTLLIVPGDQVLVDRINERQLSFGGEVGVSAWNGFAMARFCAQDAARLRADMMSLIHFVDRAALPRLWRS